MRRSWLGLPIPLVGIPAEGFTVPADLSEGVLPNPAFFAVRGGNAAARISNRLNAGTFGVVPERVDTD